MAGVLATMDNSEPLIVVDGVQCDNIDYVNSNDVENISVLKMRRLLLFRCKLLLFDYYKKSASIGFKFDIYGSLVAEIRLNNQVWWSYSLSGTE